MNTEAIPIMLLRAGALFLPVFGILPALALKGAGKQQMLSAIPAFLWCFFSLLILNPLAARWGFWDFTFEGGGFAGAPVDLLLGWAIWWGFIPCFFPSKRAALSLGLWMALFLLFDALFMPLLTPLLQLKKHWILFDILCLLIAFVPSRLLFHFTFQKQRLFLRVALQLICFVAVFVFVLPTAAWLHFEPSGASFAHWIKKLVAAVTKGGLFSMAFCLSSVLGLGAVWEFCLRGRGTPTPFDPPKRLVATGPYGFVRNPMQISLLLIYLSFFFIEPFSFEGAGRSLQTAPRFGFAEGIPPALGFQLVCLFVIISIVFYSVFTIWSESRDLERRFGPDWAAYKKEVSYFIPRYRAFRIRPAELYIDYNNCGACARFFELVKFLKPQKLVILPAEDYRYGPINRVTYREANGWEAIGTNAFARILEHGNILLAFAGFALQLPGLSHVLQIFSDMLFPPHYVKTKIKSP